MDDFCCHIEEEAKRLYHMFPAKPNSKESSEEQQSATSVQDALKHGTKR